MGISSDIRHPAQSLVVIGAGAVGVCAALELQRRGYEVTLLDGGQPGGGASFGNSGMLVADTAMPTAQPGMTWKIPGWLLDPDGPLVIQPSYLPKAAPWLWRYWMAASRRQVLQTSKALRALHHPTFSLWRRQVGDEAMDRFTRRLGQIYLWEGEDRPDPLSLENVTRRNYGIDSEELDRKRLEDLLPGLAPQVRRGLLLPGNGHSINPVGLVRAAVHRFQTEGGHFLNERVLRIWPEAGGWRIVTNLGNHNAARLVIAAGAWSARLLSPLGIGVPLETERGYHVMLHNASIDIPLPILNKSGYFGVSTMQDGLRVSGTVEIAGLDSPMRQERARRLVGQVRRLFPDLHHNGESYWMGHRPSTPDGLPLIGPIDGQPGLFACFGHAHSGLTAAPASAVLLADLIAGTAPSIDPMPYQPSRYA